MIFYRMMRKGESRVVSPVKITHRIIDLVYSNSMPSRGLFPEERQIWSLAKSPEAALTWLGERGKGLYDRLAWYDFKPEDGDIYDLTELRTWVALIGQSQSLTIQNLNYKTSAVDAVRSIIPCMKSAWSMANACEEVIFIPARVIEFNIAPDYTCIPLNPAGEEAAFKELIDADDKTIDALLKQLEKYDVRSTLHDALIDLKSA